MKELVREAVYLLKSIIQIPSFSREEEQVSDFLEQYIIKHNLPVERIGNNLLILNKKADKSRPTLLLNSHMDTVKSVSTWTKNPFGADVIDGKIYGLGSNDAGASLISLLLTTIKLYGKLDYNLAFCASAEEEISGANGIEKVLQKYSDFDLALVGEPTQMKSAVAEKGLMVLDIEAKGKSGHAARDEGINAIYKAINDIAWFENYQFEKVSPFLGPVKMSVTQINAGTQHNVVPDTCRFVVDVRGNGCYTNSEILDFINKSINATATARSIRLNSSKLPVNHKMYKTLNSLNFEPFGSPTLSDQALMHFPSFKLGPGDSSRSHTADEFIYIDEIEEALVKYHQLLTAFKF